MKLSRHENQQSHVVVHNVDLVADSVISVILLILIIQSYPLA
jgi:hypothetical protein